MVNPAIAAIIGIAASNDTCPVADIIMMYPITTSSTIISNSSLHAVIYSPVVVGSTGIKVLTSNRLHPGTVTLDGISVIQFKIAVV